MESALLALSSLVFYATELLLAIALHITIEHVVSVIGIIILGI